jgi:hypothetical protein
LSETPPVEIPDATGKDSVAALQFPIQRTEIRRNDRPHYQEEEVWNPDLTHKIRKEVQSITETVERLESTLEKLEFDRNRRTQIKQEREMEKQRKKEETLNRLVEWIDHNSKELQNTVNDSILKEANKIEAKLKEQEESWQERCESLQIYDKEIYLNQVRLMENQEKLKQEILEKQMESQKIGWRGSGLSNPVFGIARV